MSDFLRTVTRVGAMKGERGYRALDPSEDELDANQQVARDLLAPTSLTYDDDVLPMSIVVADNAYGRLVELARAEGGELSLRRVSELIGSSWADGCIVGALHEATEYEDEPA